MYLPKMSRLPRAVEVGAGTAPLELVAVSEFNGSRIPIEPFPWSNVFSKPHM